MSFAIIVSYLRELNIVSLTLRLLIAMICGGLIGASRGKRQHAAGMRTHLLVCLGAASCVMVGQFISETFTAASDPVRMAAQVVSGIGFLGAGSIIVTGKNHITGLTTAAGLWASACMGIASGAGFYEGAVIMTILIYISLVTLNKLDEKHIKSSNVITAYIEIDPDLRMSSLLTGMAEIGLELSTVEQFGRDSNEFCGYKIEVDIVNPNLKRSQVLGSLGEIEGVQFVEELRA
ncbi:MAG: MgtC/SapB family protein [Ruminococcaceae bacterium]|nr:MgtC/SapB family protein [Oscillospiraceae bacterium]